LVLEPRMSRPLIVRVHLIASVVAVACVGSFIFMSLAVEAIGNDGAIRAAKQVILYGLALLVPALACAGITGRRLAGRSRAPLVARKLRRMKMIAATGILVLVPCAITLNQLAGARSLGLGFAIVQLAELLAGTANLTLLTLNLRDGLALGAKRRARSRAVRSVAG
jgi:hypothetical protein